MGAQQCVTVRSARDKHKHPVVADAVTSVKQRTFCANMFMAKHLRHTQVTTSTPDDCTVALSRDCTVRERHGVDAAAEAIILEWRTAEIEELRG